MKILKLQKKIIIIWSHLAEKLPNYNKYVDQKIRNINNDFGTSVDNMEAPWGKAEFIVDIK